MTDLLFVLSTLSSNFSVVFFLKLQLIEVLTTSRRAEYDIRYRMSSGFISQHFVAPLNHVNENIFWGQMASRGSFSTWNTGRCCATPSCNYLSLHLWCQKKEESKKENIYEVQHTGLEPTWAWFLVSL